ncbi:MAG: glycosyltransferase family 39 protein [Anaerolineales bacterium]|nr:glycosyltransferase family 39 protein [Anaerolineales bacterium]
MTRQQVSEAAKGRSSEEVKRQGSESNASRISAQPPLGTHHVSRLTLYALSATLLLYAGLSFYQINLPGLHYDEAFEAVPALQLWQGQPVAAFRNSGLTLGGQIFPLMTQDYIGALNTYAAVPFIAWLGPTPAALRVWSILVGMATLGLTYLLVQQLSGQSRIGLSAALLLAVDPTFIFWNRQGIFVTAITAAIGLAATLCWLRWLRGGSTAWAVAGAFLFGLGLYAKFLFLWLIAALVAAVILLNLPRLLKNPAPLKAGWNSIKNHKPQILLAAVAFLAGCWPLIAYNIQTGGTFASVTQNAATSYYGVNNLAFGPNLVERFRQFVAVLDGSHLWYLGRVIGNPIPPLVFFLLLLGVVIKASLNPSPAAPAALFPFLVIGLVILASIATVSALWVTHFAVLMPWPAIAIALGIWFAGKGSEVGDRGSGIMSGWQTADGKAADKTEHAIEQSLPLGRNTFYVSRFIIPIALALLLITNLASVSRYHLALAESGGLSSHSDAIYDLSGWLAAHPDRPVIAMDWGLAAPVTYLTGGRVTPTEVFGYVWAPDAELTPRLQRFIAQPAALYLWRAPDEIIFDRSPEFKALYRPLNLEETIEAAFYERSGRPVLGVTRLVKCGTPGINSPEPASHCK